MRWPLVKNALFFKDSVDHSPIPNGSIVYVDASTSIFLREVLRHQTEKSTENSISDRTQNREIIPSSRSSVG